MIVRSDRRVGTSFVPTRIGLISFAYCFLFFTYSHMSVVSAECEEFTSDELQIIAYTIEPSNVPPGKAILLADFTESQDLGPEIMNAAEPETVDNYKQKNVSRCVLPDGLSLKRTKYYLLSPGEISRLPGISMDIYDPDAEKLIEEKYPGAVGSVHHVSRVGFNTGRSEALVYIESSVSGVFLLYEKDESGWVVKQGELAWIY